MVSDLENCKLKTIKNILKYLPSDTALRVAKKTNLCETYIYNTIKKMKKAKWIAYDKVGRSNKIELLEKGKKLKEALEEL